MRLGLRILLCLSAAAGVALWFMVDWVLKDLRPRYLEATEEPLVDTAHLAAAWVGESLDRDGGFPAETLERVFADLHDRRFEARIYDLLKTRSDLGLIVTDAEGRVVFDAQGQATGEDYSQWRDILLTLRGEYGARATRTDPDDPASSLLHVAAPVIRDGRIVGVVSVSKPSSTAHRFMELARGKVIRAAWAIGGVAVLLSALLAAWIVHPVRRLTRYARAVGRGERVRPPRLGRDELGEMGRALESMRTALDGKGYVESYVQSLTHQLKSPLSAIRGAAELLQEDMPPERRAKFLANIGTESERLHQIVDRMLQLASVEQRQELEGAGPVDVAELLADIRASLRPELTARALTLDTDIPPGLTLTGERFLVQQALANLVQNAADFSPDGGRIEVRAEAENGAIRVAVRDRGPGLPGYAAERVFERFYSLPRPRTGRKGSGLGLCFAREVAALHGGEVSLSNHPEGGAEAVMLLPAGHGD